MAIQEDDAVYFRKREQEERDLAELANGPEDRQIHQTLAQKYSSLAAKAERSEALGIRLVTDQGLFVPQSA